MGIALEVNEGKRDPEDLAELIVQQEYQEEEIITDPVLKALRKYDEEHTNKISLGLFRELFDAMKEDELGVGTHVFYGDITNDELEWAKGTMQELGNEVDVTYEDLK